MEKLLHPHNLNNLLVNLIYPLIIDTLLAQNYLSIILFPNHLFISCFYHYQFKTDVVVNSL